MSGESLEETFSNEFSGQAENVVQAKSIGSVHISQPNHWSLPIPRQLPVSVSHFTNRSAEIRQLNSLFLTPGRDGASASVALIAGIGGVGKTSLAIYWAHQARDHFPGGQLFANLHGYDGGAPTPPEQVLDGFLRALDVPPSRLPLGIENMAGLYRSLVEDRRLVVVLDNALTTDQIRPLLPSRSSIAVITTRSAMSSLVVREGALRIALTPFDPDDAIALFRTVVGSDQVDAEISYAAAAARECGYLPLALRITAERAVLPGATLAAVSADLAAGQNRLDSFAIADERGASEVRSVFSWSYRNLPVAAARLFRILGLHAGPNISTCAAAALSAASLTETKRLLDTLVGFTMLEQVGRDRYQFHDLVHAYAVERLREDEPDAEQNAALDRELGWYLYTVDAADRMLVPTREHISLEPPDAFTSPVSFDSYEQTLEWCDAERLNMLAAVKQSEATGRHKMAWKMAISLTSYLHLRRHLDDWRETSEVGVRAATSVDDLAGEARCLTSLGGACTSLKHFEEAKAAHERSLAICRELGARTGEGRALSNLGENARYLGRYEEAISFGEQALTVWRELGDRRGEAIAIIDALASVHLDRGQYTESLALYERALRACQGIDVHATGLALLGMGRSARGLGRMSDAYAYFRAAFLALQECGDRVGEGSSLRGVAAVQRTRGEYKSAEESLRAALAIFLETDPVQAAAVQTELHQLGQGPTSQTNELGS